jgi:hypothetical protein
MMEESLQLGEELDAACRDKVASAHLLMGDLGPDMCQNDVIVADAWCQQRTAAPPESCYMMVSRVIGIGCLSKSNLTVNLLANLTIRINEFESANLPY